MSDRDMKKTNTYYWTSLDQLKCTPRYRRHLLEQYRDRDNHHDDNTVTRRDFLTVMAASLALAGLAGCRKPVEKIIPYVSQPEEIIPGVPQYYATSMPLGLSAFGLIVECHEGRPTKVEGNPVHSSTGGATGLFIQSSTLGLYDPDRSKMARNRNVEVTYDTFVTVWRELHDKFIANKGDGLAFISEEFSSPTLARLKTEILKAFPKAKWVSYEPISDENILGAVKNLTGNDLRPIYKYDLASVILSLDSDFLQTESEALRAAREFADGRRMNNTDDSMNRLYVVESAFTITGGMADHRYAIQSSRIDAFLSTLLKELQKRGLDISGNIAEYHETFDISWISALAEDLMANKGANLVVAGRRQPAQVHELVLLLNNALGNIGRTMDLIPMRDTSRSDTGQLKTMIDAIAAGKVDTLVILGGNPVYNAPVDLNFGEAIQKIEHNIHFSEYYDETSQKCEWHIPRAHYLESWGDVRAADGTVGIIQPMIEPLYGAHSDSEMYSLMATGRDQRGYDIVRETWGNILNGGDFENRWRRVLHEGLLKTEPLLSYGFRPLKNFGAVFENLPDSSKDSSDELELGFYPSYLYDGRYANNGWLQELPHSVSKLAWSNAALINPQTAATLEVGNNDIVSLGLNSLEIEIPVWIVPGIADRTVVLPLGYGRDKVGRVADGVGVDTYRLRTAAGMSFIKGANVTQTDRVSRLANTQDHNLMEGRPLVGEATLEEYRSNPGFVSEMVEHPSLKSIYPDHDYSTGYQWGMVIDLNTCIGCDACTIACQSENNIPIVGQEQVYRGREMHWIRIDRYFSGDMDHPGMVHQPVPCQQCENAPCEAVCPVAATVHDREGLNNMTYNRCIGTRYCSNNCPYKVRRFNFFNYTNRLPETVKMAQNPDVTVRSRGVMEKCTFCIQRINRAKQAAKKENRAVRDGEIITACQQACPTRAITFGNINDTSSAVTALKKMDRNYELLVELNVRPRNSYLARLRNPNLKLAEGMDNNDKAEQG
nr:Fe-S-cluster-containing hydrogenase [candidate division Zixibacteria bacterium]